MMARNNDSHDELHERRPLLSRNHSNISEKVDSRSRWLKVPIRISRVQESALVPILGVLIVFFNECEFYLKQAALVRAIEAMACYEYYHNRNDPLAHLGKSIPELSCKNVPVQKRVASLYGALYVVRMLAAVVGTFGIISFLKAGPRRPVMILHKVNMVLSDVLTVTAYFAYPKVPIWLICLSGITSLFGGNFDVAISILFSSYADVIADSTRRNNLIFITTSLQYASQAICLPLAGYLMNMNGSGTTPQIPLIAGLGCGVITFCINYFLFPETFRSETSKAIQDQGCKDDDTTSKSLPCKQHEVLRREFGLLKIVFLLLCMLGAATSTSMIEFYCMLQYPSIKFHWTFTKTSYLVMLQAIISFGNYCLLLPFLNSLLQNRLRFSSQAASVVLITTSLLLICATSAILGLPGTTVPAFIIVASLYSLASGVKSAVQTYTTSVAKGPRSVGAALTVLSLGVTGGKVLAGLIWPVTLKVGLDWNEEKLKGLPFFVNSAIALTSWLGIFGAEWLRKSETKL